MMSYVWRTAGGHERGAVEARVDPFFTTKEYGNGLGLDQRQAGG